MVGKIAVMGAGAVGCWYGAHLALGGETVTLIGRPALADAVADRGLRLEEAGQIRDIAIDVAGPEGVAGADLVLFCVKSGDTEAAGREIAPYLAPNAVVLSLQNGVGNAARLAEVIQRPVVPVVVYVAVDMPAAGHVRHNGRGELILGPGAAAETAAARLRAAGLKAEVSDQAETAAWTKFTINCCINALSALTRQDYGHIAAQDGAFQMMRDILAECRAVADASGVTLPDTIWEDVVAVTRTMAGQFSSTAQDMLRGRRTEIDHLNGEILRRAKAFGIPVPVNNALWVLVRLAERPSVKA